jgi:hypothetical protein
MKNVAERTRGWSKILLAALIAASAAAAAQASDVGRIVSRAQTSVREASPAVQADLAGLIDALRASRDAADQSKLIDAIASLGDAAGASPAAVKTYLRATAPPVLLDIARGPADWTVRGEAFTCLRTLDASDAVLDQAIAIAEADSSPQQGFIRSRGEILRSWRQSRPGGVSAAGSAKPADAGAEQRALEFLRKRHTGVSFDSLQRAVAGGDAGIVEALMDAGLSIGGPDAARANQIVINGLTSACSAPVFAGDRVLAAIDVLARRGFGLGYKDAMGNTILMWAAQSCPASVAARLVELGAEVDPVNKQDFTPLQMAFVGGRWDTAKVLVDRGARLSKQQSDRLFFELPHDPAQRELVARATR